MKKRIAFAVLGLIVLIGVLGGMKALQISTLIAAGESMQEPPTSVTSAEVTPSDWETTVGAIGTLEAAQGVMITADLPGRVTALHFDGGEEVEKGELLVELDTRTEVAQLAAAEADLKLAKSNLDRASSLYDSRVVSRAEFDQADAELNAAEAQVENIRSGIEKKRIVAPFSGRLGLRLVDIGQDLAQGVPVVSLQAIDPMRVNFSLPQQALVNLKEGFPVRVHTDAVPGQQFHGEIIAIDTQIDESTRTLRVQAEIDNPENGTNKPSLLPGMFATVDVILPQTRQVLMIPLTSVSFATYGDSVFVIEPGESDSQVARQQFVQLGERRGDFVEVTKGLEAGQTVASNGVFKLRNGAPVMLKNEGKPDPSLNPEPDNA